CPQRPSENRRRSSATPRSSRPRRERRWGEDEMPGHMLFRYESSVGRRPVVKEPGDVRDGLLPRRLVREAVGVKAEDEGPPRCGRDEPDVVPGLVDRARL